MRLDEQQLDEYTDRFTSDALRYETLTYYDVASDGDDFARFLAGEPGPSPEVVGGWGRWVQQQRSRGATVRRVRVLREPPSDYLRFEMGWAYVANVSAGEDIRILDLTERPAPAEVVDAEFWMLDRQRIALMAYSMAGKFLHAHALDGDDAAPYVDAAETAWRLAEPFPAWWARHPEYHRPVAASA
jgi:hypothetical protein